MFNQGSYTYQDPSVVTAKTKHRVTKVDNTQDNNSLEHSEAVVSVPKSMVATKASIKSSSKLTTTHKPAAASNPTSVSKSASKHVPSSKSLSSTSKLAYPKIKLVPQDPLLRHKTMQVILAMTLYPACFVPVI